MKKWIVTLFICCLANSFSQTNVSPHFSELKGMEDQQGSTHLFYRIYEYFSNEFGNSEDNSIYHFDLETIADSLFLRDYIQSDPVIMNAIQVNDYKFWNHNPAEFIYVGTIGGQDPVPFINRFDQPDNLLNYFCCEVKNLDISNADDSLIYSGGELYGESQSNTNRSSDGGFTWDTVIDSLMFLSLNPFNDNVLFLETYYGFLYRSTDAGNTFNLVDLLNQPASSSSFLYDMDQLHIYRLFSNQTLRVSPNKGEPFSWQTKYSSDSEIFISIDESVFGTIYLADKKNILVSTDYSNNFSLYKSLDRNIVGIYKKSNSNKLYAATKYKIYEITPDTVQVIKSLPIPEEVLNYYPLAIGNKWVNLIKTVINPNIYYDVISTEVLSDSVASNGKLYYHLKEGDSHYLDRVDSLDGKVYRYFEHPILTDNEYVVADLLGEIGDSVQSFNPSYPTQYAYTKIILISTFNKWGLTKPRKVYQQVTPGIQGRIFSFTEDIGPDSLLSAYIGASAYGIKTLKGCIINGIVYGDTTLTDVENEGTSIATSFKLEQNYPNPFNPSTKIKFTIPSVIASATKQSQFVSLKIYDVLGNEIAALVNEEKPPGEYELEFNATNLPSGIYFYQLKADSFIQTKKMVLLK